MTGRRPKRACASDEDLSQFLRKTREASSVRITYSRLIVNESELSEAMTLNSKIERTSLRLR